MNILIPDHQSLRVLARNKEYNSLREMNDYIFYYAWSENEYLFDVYWFLGLIDLKLKIPLKDKLRIGR